LVYFTGTAESGVAFGFLGRRAVAAVGLVAAYVGLIYADGSNLASWPRQMSVRARTLPLDQIATATYDAVLIVDEANRI